MYYVYVFLYLADAFIHLLRESINPFTCCLRLQSAIQLRSVLGTQPQTAVLWVDRFGTIALMEHCYRPHP